MFIIFLGYVPKTIKKGEDEYMIVVQGVQDTGNRVAEIGQLRVYSEIVMYIHGRG
jgi:hypothetical protein